MSFDTHRRGAAASLAAVAAAIAALGAGAMPASAITVRIHGHGYGVTLIKGVSPARVNGAYAPGRSPLAARTRGVHRADEPPFGGSALEWFGGPVMHSENTHVIYWDPGKEFSETTTTIVNSFLTDVAKDSGKATNVFPIAGQYTDGTGNAAYSSTFAGPVTDTHAYPASGCTAPKGGFADPGPPYTNCLTDSQLQLQISEVIAKEGLPKGPANLYFLLLPHKVVTCAKAGECSNNVFCAYHSYISPGTAGEIIYADIPFSLLDETFAKGCQADNNAGIQTPNGDSAGTTATTRFADVAVKYLSHEFTEAVTDPLVGATKGSEDLTAWVDQFGYENGDKCNAAPFSSEEEGEPGFDKHAFTPTLEGEAAKDNLVDQSINGGHFYIQSEWDNAAKACRMAPLAISAASFTSSPAKPLEGEAVKFEGAATDPYGHQEFLWKFGDGTEGVGASPTHVYASAASYSVTMTATDARTGATIAPVKHTVSVDESPVAFFEYEPLAPTVETPVKFDASESEDEDGKIEKYIWEFGDGTTGEGVKVEHKYSEPGEYAVVLTVEDSSGLTAEEIGLVEVTDHPTATTEPASSVGQLSATLNATVNPNGETTECKFEWGPTEAYGKEAPCSAPPGASFEDVAESAALSELEPATTYHFRVVSKNGVGPGNGSDREFTTLPKVAPSIASEAASAITQTGATLNATVNPHGAEVTECKVEYGTSVFYEATQPCAALPGAGASPVAVTASVGGLAAGTTYHFRVVAQSSAGTGAGTDATFTTTTTPAPPKEAGKAPPKGEGAKPPAPDSSFAVSTSVNRRSGAITFTATVHDPGAFTLILRFANGKFGVFSSSMSKCKKGFTKLGGKCRPVLITYAKGAPTAAGAGTVTFTLKPSASAKRALAAALRRHKALALSGALTFQSSRGGAPVTHAISLSVKPKKK